MKSYKKLISLIVILVLFSALVLISDSYAGVSTKACYKAGVKDVCGVCEVCQYYAGTSQKYCEPKKCGDCEICENDQCKSQCKSNQNCVNGVCSTPTPIPEPTPTPTSTPTCGLSPGLTQVCGGTCQFPNQECWFTNEGKCGCIQLENCGDNGRCSDALCPFGQKCGIGLYGTCGCWTPPPPSTPTPKATSTPVSGSPPPPPSNNPPPVSNDPPPPCGDDPINAGQCNGGSCPSGQSCTPGTVLNGYRCSCK